MSLVQTYIHKDYIVVCGDKRVVFDDHISDHFKKVFKLNKTTIIGMAGSIGGNACLFGDYINKDYSINKICKDLSFSEIEANLIKRFNDNQQLLNELPVHSVLCGWNGNEMICKTFFTNDSVQEVNGIHRVMPDTENDIAIVNCGRSEHYHNALVCAKSIEHWNIDNIKRLFQNVLLLGSSFDVTINIASDFEIIKRDDVI